MRNQWTDVDLTTADGQAPVIRPIRIKRWDYAAIHVFAGDSIAAIVTDTRPDGTTFQLESPGCPFKVSGTSDHALKFEMIGDLGEDMGVGVIFALKQTDIQKESEQSTH